MDLTPELCAEYLPRIRNYVARHCDNPDDVAQQVFVRALVAIRNGNGCNKSASGWLFQIARSELIDTSRRKRVEWELLDHELAAGDDLANNVINDERRTELRNMIRASVTDEQWEVIRRRVEGYKIREIAAELGKTQGSVKALSQRAVTQIKNKMEQTLWQ